MSRLACLALCWVLPAVAQVAAPDDWRKETFSVPLLFAPSIPYEGTEHVRFSAAFDADVTDVIAT